MLGILTALLAVIALAPFAIGLHVYVLYGASLRLAARLGWGRSPKPLPAPVELPYLSVIVAARNEERAIVARLQNLLALGYPSDRMEIVVASDGSTDATVAQAEKFGVRVVAAADPVGKSTVQNRAVEEVRGSVVVFTDAGTHFEPGFLHRIATAFEDPEIGVVDAQLQFRTAQDDGLGRSQSVYWRMEQGLRRVSSTLGILLVCAGACVAVRKTALAPFPAHVGEDCVIPLAAFRKGFRTAHVADAIAHDSMKQSFAAEFRSRVRMTQRNWQGTWMYPDLLNPLRHPVQCYALFSHKLLRWLLPFFVLASIVAAACLSVLNVATGNVVLVLWLLFAVFIALGALAGRVKALRHFAFLWSFAVANCGFLIGVWRAVRHEQIHAYTQ